MLKKLHKITKEVIVQFQEDNCFSRAAGLAYTTLLSMVPLLTVVFSVLAAFPVFHGLTEKVQDFIFNNFVATAAQTVQQHLQNFINQTSKLPAWGLLSLLVAAVLLVFTMEQAFNAIWRVKKRRQGTTAFILYWGVLTLLPILLAVGIAASTYLMNLPQLSDTISFFNLNKILLVITPYLLTLLAFTMLYVAMPNCKVPTKPAFYAAIFTTILFEAIKEGFSFYITNFPTYKLIYGALASIPIFLVWLYIFWTIILFGAVLSHVLTNSNQDAINK